jgi:NitT/TauT family transport system ATP-binding protein
MPVLQEVSLRISEGEFVTFFGPNGCGKTTLLNIIAGLDTADSGWVKIKGQPPKEVFIGAVFQNYREMLLPWRKNIDNVAFPLELRGMKKRARYLIARDFLRKLNIQFNEDSYPYKLSGGQQQLLVIVQALIAVPALLIMDEPFSALDYTTRMFMQDQLLSIWRKTKKTILFVSHEIDEALYLADRTVFFSKRPARVIKIIENPLPQPRNRQMLRSKAFFDLKSEALKVFHDAISEE